MPEHDHPAQAEADGALSDRALAGLRCTAAMVTALPTLRARIRHRDRLVLEVRRPPFDDPAPGHPILPPCAFHRAVRAAHLLRRSGERLAFRGFPPGADPAIDWGVGPGDLSLAGSMVRVVHEDAWLHVAAVAVPLVDCAAAVMDTDGGPPGIGFHGDSDVEVTLIHLRTPIGDHVASAEVIDALRTAIARTAVHELLDRLGAEAPDSPATLGS